MNIQDAIVKAEHVMLNAGLDNVCREVCWMMEEVLHLSDGMLRSHLDAALSDDECRRFEDMVRRRASGEPLQYVIGNVDFYTVRLEVGPGVLIPRPETEELVERALELWRGLGRKDGVICDVCTGSGAIALALAQECPDATVYGTDISPEALGWAERNRGNLELGNVALLEGDLFSPLPEETVLDMVVSNPPYVSESDYGTLESCVRDYEPRLALVAAHDGLALLERVAADALNWLRPGGWLCLEMGDEQGARMRATLEGLGYEAVSIRKDMGGHDRMAFGRKAL